MPTRIGGNDGLHSHIPIGELLFDVPNSGGRLLCALLPSMQATQLRCGGFIVALRLDRTVADGARALGNAQPSPHHMHLPQLQLRADAYASAAVAARRRARYLT